jgi:hypothetical protein
MPFQVPHILSAKHKPTSHKARWAGASRGLNKLLWIISLLWSAQLPLPRRPLANRGLRRSGSCPLLVVLFFPLYRPFNSWCSQEPQQAPSGCRMVFGGDTSLCTAPCTSCARPRSARVSQTQEHLQHSYSAGTKAAYRSGPVCWVGA